MTLEQIAESISLEFCMFPDGRVAYGPVWAEKLAAAIAAAIREREEPQIVNFRAAHFEGEDWVVTANGEPCGCTLTKREANAAAGWAASAWAELMRANARAADAKGS